MAGVKTDNLQTRQKIPKKRVFYLDFIRAIATLSIILTHYNALFLTLTEPKPEKCILFYEVFNIYIGAWGVSLFFIISGAALMYTYENGFSILNFYKKRIISIYPMWWLAYVGGLSFWFLKYKTYNPWGVPNNEGWKMILSVLGFDQYFAAVTPTFSILGEWFLGCIILLYILYPILRKFVLEPRQFWWVWPILVALYFMGIYTDYNPLPTVNKIFVRIPEFVFGMIFAKYVKNHRNWKWALGAGIVLIVNTILRPGISSHIQTTYVGITSFLCLVFVASYLNKVRFVQICATLLCKYSYAIYLVHHIIIYQITSGYDLSSISRIENYVLFFVTCEVIMIFSVILHRLNRNILNGIRSVK